MKTGRIFLLLFIGFVVGVWAGWHLATQQARIAVLAGPYSDNYRPALSAMAKAKAKLQSGDTNVLADLNEVQFQIEKAQQWTKKFLGKKIAIAEEGSRKQPESATNSGGHTNR